MKDSEAKKWRIEYNHKDGRAGTIEVETEIVESEAFDYGNGKDGALIINGFAHCFDLRYSQAEDLHRAMIDDYFGKGLVSVTEI